VDSLGDFMNILPFPQVRKSEKLAQVTTGALGLMHIDEYAEEFMAQTEELQ
jgi:hypothetical protein